MGDKTGINWCDATWNPTRGCSRVSEGCRNCYAEAVAGRFCGPGQPYDGLATRTLRVASDDEQRVVSRWTGDVRFVVEKLAEPLRWTRSRRIFVDSMSDLFHDGFSNEQIAAVFGVMAACPQHTFLVLTKRARRMREWFEWVPGFALDQRDICAAPNKARTMLNAAAEFLGTRNWGLNAAWEKLYGDLWPLPNVHLGVSVENRAALARLDDLRACPAAVRIVSFEPLLEMLGDVDLSGIGWAIAGCESGANARPCDVAWLRSLRDQCRAAGVPFWLKQARADDERCSECKQRVRYWVQEGEPVSSSASCGCTVEGPEDCNGAPDIAAGPGSKRKPGGIIDLPYLDGVQHAELP